MTPRAAYRPLTLRCSYCDGGSMWYTERDQHEYCPAHLFIAQLKNDAWEAAALAVLAQCTPQEETPDV